jgi:hypothetical protein
VGSVHDRLRIIPLISADFQDIETTDQPCGPAPLAMTKWGLSIVIPPALIRIWGLLYTLRGPSKRCRLHRHSRIQKRITATTRIGRLSMNRDCSPPCHMLPCAPSSTLRLYIPYLRVCSSCIGSNRDPNVV